MVVRDSAKEVPKSKVGKGRFRQRKSGKSVQASRGRPFSTAFIKRRVLLFC